MFRVCVEFVSACVLFLWMVHKTVYLNKITKRETSEVVSLYVCFHVGNSVKVSVGEGRSDDVGSRTGEAVGVSFNLHRLADFSQPCKEAWLVLIAAYGRPFNSNIAVAYAQTFNSKNSHRCYITHHFQLTYSVVLKEDQIKWKLLFYIQTFAQEIWYIATTNALTTVCPQ